MFMTLAGSGIALSDGPTNMMPIAAHRGEGLSDAQRADNRTAVWRAWRLHYKHVRDALYNGFYQGWDLHPAQLPIRYAAVYSFFLEGLDAASERLRNFIEQGGAGHHGRGRFRRCRHGTGVVNYLFGRLVAGRSLRATFRADSTVDGDKIACFAQAPEFKQRVNQRCRCGSASPAPYPPSALRRAFEIERPSGRAR